MQRQLIQCSCLLFNSENFTVSNLQILICKFANPSECHTADFDTNFQESLAISVHVQVSYLIWSECRICQNNNY